MSDNIKKTLKKIVLTLTTFLIKYFSPRAVFSNIKNPSSFTQRSILGQLS